MTTILPFPEPVPSRGRDLEALGVTPVDLPEWSAGRLHLHHFQPLDVSAADRYVRERLLHPGDELRRAIDDVVAAIRDVAATTWSPRRLRRAGYGIGSAEVRREARRRTALAAELRALRRLR